MLSSYRFNMYHILLLLDGKYWTIYGLAKATGLHPKDVVTIVGRLLSSNHIKKIQEMIEDEDGEPKAVTSYTLTNSGVGKLGYYLKKYGRITELPYYKIRNKKTGD